MDKKDIFLIFAIGLIGIILFTTGKFDNNFEKNTRILKISHVNEQLQGNAYLGFLETIPGVKQVQAAPSCIGIPEPLQCPISVGNTWSEYNLVCAELTSGDLLWIRNCYQAKN